MSEFCPRCTAPLETSQDSDRLCELCGWFGDQQESLLTPPAVENPLLRTAQLLELYREVCRKELEGEQKRAAGIGTDAELHKVHAARRHAAHSILEMFAGMESQAAMQVLRRINGVISWPAHWADRHYNASNEPCDTLVGPCSCGAWHLESEDWVQAMLVKHNARIIDQ
jgi:hypothetical protein